MIGVLSDAGAMQPARQSEHIHLLAVANSAEFGHLSPSQIVPRLADRGEYLASESTFYRVLKAENQLMHRRAERPAHPRAKPRALRATAPNRALGYHLLTYADPRIGFLLALIPGRLQSQDRGLAGL